MKGNLFRGSNYLVRGFKLLSNPGIRLFIIVPVLVNLVIFSILIYVSIQQITVLLAEILTWLPEWLAFLEFLLWPLAVIFLLVVVTYSFSLVANFIASPFNGLLAEKVEEMLTEQNVPGPDNLVDALKDFPRAIKKELQKIAYYIPKALIAIVLTLVFSFTFPPAVTFIWFALGAWMMSLQYCDFPMDNYQMSLEEVRQSIATERMTSLGFGASVMFATMVPVLNFLVMPAAVCGATIYWVEQLKPQS